MKKIRLAGRPPIYTHPVMIRIEVSLVERLQKMAMEERSTVTGVVRRLVEEGVERSFA